MPNITELIIILIIISIVFGFGKLTSIGTKFSEIKDDLRKGLDSDSVDESDEAIDITPERESPSPGYSGPKPGKRKHPIEDADIEP